MHLQKINLFFIKILLEQNSHINWQFWKIHLKKESLIYDWYKTFNFLLSSKLCKIFSEKIKKEKLNETYFIAWKKKKKNYIYTLKLTEYCFIIGTKLGKRKKKCMHLKSSSDKTKECFSTLFMLIILKLIILLL